MRKFAGSGATDGPRRYVLVYRTFAGARVFVAREPVALVSTQFLRAASEERFEILTYCFMPDHAQLLVEARDETCDRERFQGHSKHYSGSCYTARTGRRLWQRESFERILRNHEGSRAVSRFILEAPVRAGLVARPQDYVFSGSFAWDRQPT